MTWMLIACGRVVDFADPVGTAAALPVETIAHSLATINRFTGHAARPYSVAEHSLLVCEIIERTFGAHPLLLLGGLLHDAHECVTNDLASPAKPVIGPGWAAFEDEWKAHFRSAFGLGALLPAWRKAIKTADLLALATERRDLLPPGGPDWALPQGIQPVAWINLRSRDRMAWSDWRQAFIDRYHELAFALQLRGGHHTPGATPA